MATGPRDTGPKQPDKAPGDAPRRLDFVQPPVVVRDRADMVSINADGHDRFRRNSERMQEAAKAKSDRQPPSQSNSPGKDVSTGKDGRGSEAPRDLAQGERQLRFAKDHERGARQALKVEQAKEQAKQLTFVKDQGQDINRGR